MENPIRLSLLIPIYNEEENLVRALDRLLAVPWPYPIEMVFVDDRSTDASLAKLREWLTNHETALVARKIVGKVILHPENQGKGAAIHSAIEAAAGEVLIVQDADEEYVPAEVPSLVEPILEDRADVVYGSRFKKNVLQAHRTYHYLINRFLTTLSNLASGLYVTDMETCYKAFRADVLKNLRLESRRFGFEPEVTAHVARLKARIWELPISYYPRTHLQGKKITWKDGVAALWHIFYYNFWTRDRFLASMPAQYLVAPVEKKSSLALGTGHFSNP
jgi:glycosyltransferase involved in cell wall biosynthesis